jgi:alkylation response protein AidB-like acyl-CoA dehydrogenase
LPRPGGEHRRGRRRGLTIAARCIGGAQFLLDATIARAKTRNTFGAPLADRQAIQWMIADVATEIEELRWLVRYAAWKIDSGDQARRETAMAKLRGPQVYHHAADVAMQVHGGEGFTTSLPIERAYRRARGYRFIEGTDEMQRRSLAADLLR